MNKTLKIIDKYKSMSKEVKAAFWYTICNTLLKAISLITVPIFTRVLTEEDYGLVSVFNGWHEIIFIVATLNLFYSAYNTAHIKYKDDLECFVSSMLGLIYTIVFLLIIVYLSFKSLFDNLLELSPNLLIVIVMELLTVPAYYFWMAGERFRFNYRRVVIVTSVISASAPLLSLLLIMLFPNNKAFYKIFGTAFPSICAGVFLTCYFFRKGKTFFKKEYWTYGLKFNIPLIPHYLSGTILNQSDRIMISKMISVNKAGIYSVAYSASFTVSILTTAINQSVVPWMYNRIKDEDYSSIAVRVNQILVAFATVLLFFILIIPEILSILAPESYSEANVILPVLVMSVYFQFLYGFFGTIDFYYEQPVFPMIASVIAASSNLIGNFFLIPKYGYLAAGYTTLFSYVIMTIAHYYFMKIVLKKNNVNHNIFETKIIVAITISFIFFAKCESLLYAIPLVRYVLVTLIIIAICLKMKKLLN